VLDEFDKTIPLFNIEDRRVEILSSDIFKKPSLILVEGGEGTIGALRDKLMGTAVSCSTNILRPSKGMVSIWQLELLHSDEESWCGTWASLGGKI